MILSAYLCQNVSQSIANACSRFLFPVHFFGRNVTQFISNDGLKILGIIKTCKITSSFLKIDVFFLCTSTIFSKVIFFFWIFLAIFFPFICSWVILRKKVFLPLKIASLHSICCFGQYPHQWLQPIHNPPFKMSSRWCFGLLTILFLIIFVQFLKSIF